MTFKLRRISTTLSDGGQQIALDMVGLGQEKRRPEKQAKMELESYVRAAVTWLNIAEGKHLPKGSVRAGPHSLLCQSNLYSSTNYPNW